MEKRIYNFSAGPAILPEEVLKEAQKNLTALPDVGMSILEISHRSKTFDDIFHQTKDYRNLIYRPRMVKSVALTATGALQSQQKYFKTGFSSLMNLFSVLL